jgi:hypothetical protein
MQSFDDCYTDVEDFITNIFTQLEREVEGMKKESGNETWVIDAYNQALKDILNLIKKYRGKPND